MDTSLNLPYLRHEALKGLRRHGSKPMSNLEAWIIGDLIGSAIGVSKDASQMDHPLLQAADFEVGTLDVGKYEFLLAWLSPCHPATTAMPLELGQIALYLLEIEAIPSEVLADIRQRMARVA